MIHRSLAVVLLLFGIGCARDHEGGNAGLDVVASFYPLAEVARHVGGPAVRVYDLTPAGAEPHDLELRPSDLGRLAAADVVFYFGRGFQPAVEDAITERQRAVDVLAGFELLPGTEEGETEDPHVWLDPTLMQRIARSIAGELARRTPAARPGIESRLATYEAALGDLHRSFEATLRPCERRDLVTSHAAFGYLATRYGLRQVAISGLSPEAEPSPRRLEEVATFARKNAVSTIFFETLVSPRVAHAIARDVGATTEVLNPIEGLTSEERAAGDSYVSLMRRNLAALAKGLRCARPS